MSERVAVEWLKLYAEQIRPRGLPGRGDLLGRLSPDAELSGPVVRMVEQEAGQLLLWPGEFSPGQWDWDSVVTAQCARSDELGLPLVWYCDDAHHALTARLRAAGFTPQDREEIMVGRSTEMACAPGARPALPAGTRLRPAATGADFEQVRELAVRVRGGSWNWLPAALERWSADEDDPCAVTVVEAPRRKVVAAGLVRFHTGTGFASLWGASVHPAWEGQGLYRSLLGHRAALAARRGHSYLYTEALPSSRPVLARLGMVTVTTHTPYQYFPPGRPHGAAQTSASTTANPPRHT
ncbi:GNAT family N-acetyltransferase [Streptomyces uncialis]|uniref:GNAT family N-acetyltransferase n=1 Tax=Streptomyces uncialis TaxID=1048205 RepID=UPI00224EAE0D|nr:GNAT family N-acetyltransferase [Streptomyces uncialis]MCX4657697.1 GNAT family N-acetyltransferase [Streptomyces uncialis]